MTKYIDSDYCWVVRICSLPSDTSYMDYLVDAVTRLSTLLPVSSDVFYSDGSLSATFDSHMVVPFDRIAESFADSECVFDIEVSHPMGLKTKRTVGKSAGAYIAKCKVMDMQYDVKVLMSMLDALTADERAVFEDETRLVGNNDVLDFIVGKGDKE
jgi:hypothetical protein